MALRVGDKAPDFELKSNTGETVRLSDLLQQRKYLVVVFFPAAFSPVCTDEVNLFQETISELQGLGAGVIGISVDNHWSLGEFAKRQGLKFPLLSDFHPKGKVAEQFGAMQETGAAARALFIVDRDRTVRYSYVSDPAVNPGVGRVLDRLEELEEKKEAA